MFPGQYYDQETGLHYNLNRYYDPATGRFLTADPTGLETGPNLFAYVDNNPLKWIDPLGLAKMPLPSDPSGLGPNWQPDPSHRDPNGDRYRHPNGDYVDFHKGRAGAPGWRGKDHWHHNGGKKHLSPGDEIDDPDNPDDDSSESFSCDQNCQGTWQAIRNAAGVILFWVWACVAG